MKIVHVAGPIIIEKKKILLVLDDENEYKTPEGKLEVGETLREAARRESKEEICSDVELYDLIKTYSKTVENKTYKIFNFKAKLLGKPKSGNEVKYIGWYSYLECKKMLLSLNSKNVVEFLHRRGVF